MTSSTPGRPDPVSEPDPVRQLVRLFATQLLAVIAVATVIAVVFTLAGRGTGPDVAANDGGADPSTPAATATSESPAPTTSESAPPASTTPAGTPPASATPPATTTGVGPVVAKVDVLNQSAGNSSAERVAADLRDAGWKVGRVDDFRGNVSTTTVYWLRPQDRRQARQISRFLGGVRVREGFDTLVAGRITVILVESR